MTGRHGIPDGGTGARRGGSTAPGRGPGVRGLTVCDDCLRRTDLVAALSGRIDVEWRRYGSPRPVLALADAELIALDPTRSVLRRYRAFDPAGARARIERVGMTAVCRCSSRYPAGLRDLEDPPAVLHVVGDPSALERTGAVAVVGARRATAYGLEVGRSLGRALGAAGICVVSGMAIGIDSAAHAGAIDVGGETLAVLAGGADVPYPSSKRWLYRRIAEAAGCCVVSEMPPRALAFRWSFVARNRIIAALAAATVVVEAAERSGSLTTADFALNLGRPVGAVPGPVTSSRSTGTNGLLHAGALVVRDAADVLDALVFEAPARPPPPGGADAHGPRRAAAGLPEPLQELLLAVEDGRGTLAALAPTPEDAHATLAGLTELELRGLVRRRPGGRYVPACLT